MMILSAMHSICDFCVYWYYILFVLTLSLHKFMSDNQLVCMRIDTSPRVGC